MSSGRALAIVNPVAGRAKAGRYWPALEGVLRSHFSGLTVRYTTGRGDAERWAREWADRAEVVFVAGGDGTVHEVINGLLDIGTTAHLGIIPLGTGNDFAATTGIPAPVTASLSRLGEPERRFDVGRVRFRDGAGAERQRIFLNSTSVGVVPHANRLAGKLKTRMPGRLPYSLGGLGALLKASPGKYRTTSMGQTLHVGRALSITVANGARFGAGMQISPASRADDGVLDMVVIENLGTLRALTALSRLYRGTHVRMRGVTVSALPGPLRIEREDGTILVEADGEEFQAGTEVNIDVLPNALYLVN